MTGSLHEKKRDSILLLGLMIDDALVGYRGQIHTLKRLLQARGEKIRSSTRYRHPLARLLDLIRALLVNRLNCPQVIFDVYGGRSFVIESAVIIVARCLAYRVTVILRGGALVDFAKRWPRWHSWVMRYATGIVSPSEFLASAYRSMGFRVVVIRNMIHEAAYHFQPRKVVRLSVLWMRTFHEAYNPEMAIRVLKRLTKKFSFIEFVMAGAANAHREKLIEECRQQDLLKFLEFPGFLNEEKKKYFFDRCDIFINTNRIDNMPVTVIEAAASGCAIVATKIGGIPFILKHEETALLVGDDDDEAMAEAIERYLTEPSLAARVSLQAYQELARPSFSDEIYSQWRAYLGKTA